MDEYIRAQARYLKGVENRSRAKGMSVIEYLEQKTTLLEQPEPSEPPPRREFKPTMEQMEDRARESSKALYLQEAELPVSDAVISICVSEPRGRFRFDLTIPNVGDLMVASLRNEIGYRQAFIEAMLYKFFGHIS